MDWSWTELGTEALAFLRGSIGPEGVAHRQCYGPKLFQACSELRFVRVLAFLPEDQAVRKKAAADLLNGAQISPKKGFEALCDRLSQLMGDDHYLLCAGIMYDPELYSEEESTRYTFYHNELCAVCFPGASAEEIADAYHGTMSCRTWIGVLAPAAHLDLSPYIGRELPEEVAKEIRARVRYVFSVAWDDEGFVLGEVAPGQSHLDDAGAGHVDG